MRSSKPRVGNLSRRSVLTIVNALVWCSCGEAASPQGIPGGGSSSSVSSVSISPSDVDLRALEPLPAPVVLLELDFTAPEAPGQVAEALGRAADALFCDAAPQLSGIRDVDRAATEELHDAALRVAEAVLGPGGSLVIKGFPGPESDRFRATLRAVFARVAEVRPEAKRSTSKEFYWVAMGTPPSSGRRKPRRGAQRRPKA